MFDIQKHKYLLVQILKDFYSEKEISSFIGFKGGTAAFLFYDLPRFSIDLDFNLLDLNKAKFTFLKIKKILKKYGEVKEAREKRYTLFFLLSYGEKARNIKIEISKREFPDEYEIQNYLGIPMLVMKKDDIFAHKLVAFLDRNGIANRDVFDIWYFFDNRWTLDEEIVELRTGKSLNEYLSNCIEQVNKVKNTYILQGLGEVLNEEQKSWVKSNLKKDLIFLMKNFLDKRGLSGARLTL